MPRLAPAMLSTFASALLLAACDAPSPLAPPEHTPSLARSTSAPVAMVSLGGKLDLSMFLLPDETYAMTAHRDADGDVRGTFNARLSDPVVAFRGDVTCLETVGSMAWVGVRITDSDATGGPWAAGGSFWFRLQDNGEGANAPADRISSLNPAGGAARCAERRMGLSLAWTIQGNVQVH